MSLGSCQEELPESLLALLMLLVSQRNVATLLHTRGIGQRMPLGSTSVMWPCPTGPQGRLPLLWMRPLQGIRTTSLLVLFQINLGLVPTPSHTFM